MRLAHGMAQTVGAIISYANFIHFIPKHGEQSLVRPFLIQHMIGSVKVQEQSHLLQFFQFSIYVAWHVMHTQIWKYLESRIKRNCMWTRSYPRVRFTSVIFPLQLIISDTHLEEATNYSFLQHFYLGEDPLLNHNQSCILLLP